MNTPETIKESGRTLYVAVVFNGAGRELSRHRGSNPGEARGPAMRAWQARQARWEALKRKSPKDPPMWDLYRRGAGSTYTKATEE